MPATLRSNRRFVRAVLGGVVNVSCSDGGDYTGDDNDAIRDKPADSEDGTVAEESEGGVTLEGLTTRVCYVQGSEVTIAKATQQISLISLLGMPQGMSPREKLSYLSHIIDPECEVAFRAVGGLLRFLTKEGVLKSHGGNEDLIFLNEIKMTSFADVLFMSQGTMRALQVFQLDPHPLSHGSGNAKEGLSLFGVLSKTRSVVGNRLLRSWLESPSTNIATIHERQDLVNMLRSPAHDAVFECLKECLRSVKNVPNILVRLRNISATVTDWQSLNNSIRAFLSMIEILRALGSAPSIQNSNMFRRLKLVDESSLRDSVQWISNVLDFPESKIAGRLVIAGGFSDDIDSIRACYAGLDDFLTSVSVQEVERLVRDTSLRIPRLQICYLPQVGYLCLLGNDFLQSLDGRDELITAAGFEFMFSSPNVGSYFKNAKCYELDKELGVRSAIFMSPRLASTAAA
jgi:DNA mismatch repair ATPase MutS